MLQGKKKLRCKERRNYASWEEENNAAGNIVLMRKFSQVMCPADRTHDAQPGGDWLPPAQHHAHFHRCVTSPSDLIFFNLS
jgi:hypothetical protein